MSKIILDDSTALQTDAIDDIMNSCEKYRNQLIKRCAAFFDCDIETAKDCVQDTYLALFENLSRGVKIHDYRAWLYKVVLNIKNNAVKDRLRRNEYDFDSNEEKDAVLSNEFVYDPDYVELLVTQETIEERTLKIISSLNKEERTMYLLYYHERKNLKEIAKILGISHTASRQRHVQLKRKLTEKIKEYERI